MVSVHPVPLHGGRRSLIRLVGLLPLAAAAAVLVKTVFVVVETHSLFIGIFGLAAAVRQRGLRRQLGLRQQCRQQQLQQ